MIKKYTVCQGNNLQELIKQVDEMLAEGWQPCGGLTTAGGYQCYYQAMIR